jgi:ribonuclease-3
VFLDAGYPTAREVIARTFATKLSRLDPDAVEKDAKTRLQEYLQAKRLAKPLYRVVSTQGAKQNLVFEVECAIEEPRRTARGSGSSRQRAEQQAAAILIKQIGA